MKIILLQTAIADYRDNFIFRLNENKDLDLSIYVGNDYFESSTKTSRYLHTLNNVYFIKNFFFWNRKLCFQIMPIGKILNAEVVVFELNPRLLSNWILMTLRYLMGKRNVLWGHAWSRRGEHSFSEMLRHFMRKLSNSLIFYTEEQKSQFKNKYPNYIGKLSVAPNALYPVSKINYRDGLNIDIIYVGRLVLQKKVEILIKAFSLIVDSLPSNANLRIVGSGPESIKLIELTSDLGLNSRVFFEGHVSDLNNLQEFYSNALFSVSPGYVGLSITQSLAFGKPMLISRDEPHSPELEAFVVGENGLFFETDSEVDLANTILKFYNNRLYWIGKGNKIAEDCAKRYSTEAMAEGFFNAVF